MSSMREVGTRERALLALCAIRGVNWNVVAREASRPLGLDGLLNGHVSNEELHGVEPAAAAETHALIVEHLDSLDALLSRVDREFEAAEAVDAHLVTVLDPEYPANLRAIFNLPPFLFVRGDFTTGDRRSLAVVGTRQATERGLSTAASLAAALAQSEVTVVSGLARGIDTAAHRATLDAGGRTIAVLGVGIAAKCYPAENADLAEQIVESGALVSQFFPTRGPGRDTFPRRTVVTSGISQGTVVIEASSTSGAKMQARLALQHGKRVFLLKSLVTDQLWARTYLGRGAIEVDDPSDVVRWLHDPDESPSLTAEAQLALDFASESQR